MRNRMFIMLSAVLAVMLGGANPLPAGHDVDGYNLQRSEIRGTVTYLDGQEAWILTDDGVEYPVQLGPASYWNARGYYLREGEYVTMEVWYDPYDHTDWYFAGQIWGPGFHFVLTNRYGVPFWVSVRDDYYYSLGYRASCVSYLFWYDLPPVYFGYLYLPPPPPRYYVCYYGPRWRHHHHDWHFGPRYSRGGSYWEDPRERERPGRRGHYSGPVGNSGGGGNLGPSDDGGQWRKSETRQPAVPPKAKVSKPYEGPRGNAVTPREKSPRGNDTGQERAAKPQQRERPDVRQSPAPRSPQKLERPADPRNQHKSERTYERPTPQSRHDQKYEPRRPAAPPQNQPKYQDRGSARAPDRGTQMNRPAPTRQRPADGPNVKSPPPPRPQSGKVQSPPKKEQPQVRDQKPAPQREAPRQYSKPQNSRQSGGSQDAKRSTGGSSNRGGNNNDRKSGRR